MLMFTYGNVVAGECIDMTSMQTVFHALKTMGTFLLLFYDFFVGNSICFL